jgi:RNA-directed DNA polymerase
MDGEFRVGRITNRNILGKQIKAVQRELRRRMHEPPNLTAKWLDRVLRGHLSYYGVPGNIDRLSLFKNEIVKRWFKMRRRCSQRHTITWEKFGPLARRYLPRVRIVYPYPELRFRARYSR